MCGITDLPQSVLLLYWHSVGYQPTVIYTDGSMVGGHVGYTYEHAGHNGLCSLLAGCSVFTAELVAIFRALDHISHTCTAWESYVNCSDSLSGLRALDQCFPWHPLVIAIQESLHAFKQSGQSVVFIWTLGHIGIVGNELADRLAKDVTTVPQPAVCGIQNGVPTRSPSYGL